MSEESKSTRRERLLAAKKAREEIRNAVRHELVGKIDRAELRAAANSLVIDAANRSVKDLDVVREIQNLVRDEFRKLGLNAAAIRQMAIDETRAAARREAEKFIDDNLMIKVRSGGEWS